uniref:Reverse transcriptase domain-containing protein n=1 Tax=Arundo donax TaxID=35708 RepID=A0A0A9B5F5_ARUDO
MWIKKILEGGRVRVNINGERGEFFNTYRGVTQGDPLSPLLFNLVADALANMLDRARAAGDIKGLVPHLVDGGLTHLQYADDTVILWQLKIKQSVT